MMFLCLRARERDPINTSALPFCFWLQFSMASPVICNAIKACQDFIECRSSFNNLYELRISALEKNEVLYKLAYGHMIKWISTKTILWNLIFKFLKIKLHLLSWNFKLLLMFLSFLIIICFNLLFLNYCNNKHILIMKIFYLF